VEKLEHLGYNELAEEYSGQFEGDMIISQEQLNEMESDRRNGFRDTRYRWKNRQIPYKIETWVFSEFIYELS
jgi:hypothetical protein